MTRNQLKCLLLGALFVNAALVVQGSSDNNEKTSDAVTHHEMSSKVESLTVADSPHPKSNKATETPEKGAASPTLTAKIDQPVNNDDPHAVTLAPTARPKPTTSSTTTTPPPPTKPTSTVTPPPPTTSSSQAPTTSSSPPITTSSTTTPPVPTPTPPPSPPEYNWIVRGPNSTVCILASMKIKLEYNINGTQQVIPVPENATGTGHCGNDSQVLQISWPNNTMTFSFELENKTESYSLSSIDVVSKLSSFNKTAKFSAKVKAFTTNLKNSYECTWSEPVTGPLSNNSDIAQGQLKITITDVHVEAFHNSKSDKFSLALVCQTDASDIVPVMVGIALAVLVLVVLIVYVIGRRNSQARGYLSM